MLKLVSGLPRWE